MCFQQTEWVVLGNSREIQGARLSKSFQFVLADLGGQLVDALLHQRVAHLDININFNININIKINCDININTNININLGADAVKTKSPIKSKLTSSPKTPIASKIAINPFIAVAGGNDMVITTMMMTMTRMTVIISRFCPPLFCRSPLGQGSGTTGLNGALCLQVGSVFEPCDAISSKHNTLCLAGPSQSSERKPSLMQILIRGA